jgi:Asp-tRNA(Asn)/Glu-tRNA(Gln) amidotransferase A subunit family amidase
MSILEIPAREIARWSRCTGGGGNCLGLYGLSLPNGITSTGLPTGLQLMSWSGAEAPLLYFAEEVSQGKDS